jgi:hypothetical protein
MPWTPEDGPARHTKKTNTPKKKRQLAKIANGALERGESEQSAIMQANGVLQSIVVAYARANGWAGHGNCFAVGTALLLAEHKFACRMEECTVDAPPPPEEPA